MCLQVVPTEGGQWPRSILLLSGRSCYVSIIYIQQKSNIKVLSKYLANNIKLLPKIYCQSCCLISEYYNTVYLLGQWKAALIQMKCAFI